MKEEDIGVSIWGRQVSSPLTLLKIARGMYLGHIGWLLGLSTTTYVYIDQSPWSNPHFRIHLLCLQQFRTHLLCIQKFRMQASIGHASPFNTPPGSSDLLTFGKVLKTQLTFQCREPGTMQWFGLYICDILLTRNPRWSDASVLRINWCPILI